MDEAVDTLRRHNVLPSLQRIAILKYLIRHRTHPTVEEIYTHLHPSIPTLSKTTVYNTLKLLTDFKVVQTLTIDDRNTCYDADTRPHSHFLCRQCGRVFDVEYMDGSDIFSRREYNGFVIDEAQVYFKGICKECNMKG